jgi:hypothetical protein
MTGDVRFRGSGEGLRETFQRLKQRGPQILVTGDVPEAVSRQATRRLLGHPAEQRHRVLALTDSDATSDQWLPGDITPESPDVAVLGQTRLRSAAAAQTGAEVVTRGEVLADDVADAVGTWLDTTQEPAPAVLRVGVYSLETFLEAAGVEAARSLAYRLTGAVRRGRGMGHYHLPRAPESQAVSDLRYVFDAHLELRENGKGPEQRWHIPGSGTTGWVALADEP